MTPEMAMRRSPETVESEAGIAKGNGPFGNDNATPFPTGNLQSKSSRVHVASATLRVEISTRIQLRLRHFFAVGIGVDSTAQTRLQFGV